MENMDAGKTLGELIVEVEKVLLPLGFRVEKAETQEKTSLLTNGSLDNGNLSITVVRKVRIA